MAFDIYGDRLRPGHCEVHPDVHDEYPCYLCLQEQGRDHYDYEQQRREYERELAAEADAWWRAQWEAHMIEGCACHDD